MDMWSYQELLVDNSDQQGTHVECNQMYPQGSNNQQHNYNIILQ